MDSVLLEVIGPCSDPEAVLPRTIWCRVYWVDRTTDEGKEFHFDVGHRQHYSPEGLIPVNPLLVLALMAR